MPEDQNFNPQPEPDQPASGWDANKEEEQKFSPPPTNIFIRTSESDLEKIKTGSEPQSLETPPYPTFSPAEPPKEPVSFSPPNISPVVSFEAPSPLQPEPSFAPDISPAEFPDISSAPPPPKSRFLPVVIIFALLIGGALAGYFLFGKKLLGPKEDTASPAITTTTTTTTTATLPPSPYIQISQPYDISPFKITVIGQPIVSALKQAATQETASPQTFKVLIPKIKEQALTGEEAILSLIPQLPDRLKPFVLARKYLVYAYYGEVNPSLGLIIDIGAENKEEVKSTFLSWEKGKILDDLSNFFLVKIPKKVDKSFKEKTIAGAEIRYFTYSGKEAAISYGFFGNYLVISSSLEAVNSAVSHLQGDIQSIYP